MARGCFQSRQLRQALIGIALITTSGAGAAQELVTPSIIDPAIRNGDTPYLVYDGSAGAAMRR